jgi:uncharacterized membrane protein YtjA (UPF0391 family)
MYRWAVVFFTLALVAAVLAFSGLVPAATAVVAKVLFIAFLAVGSLALIFDRRLPA